MLFRRKTRPFNLTRSFVLTLEAHGYKAYRYDEQLLILGVRTPPPAGARQIRPGHLPA